jgi:hypothetical protein
MSEGREMEPSQMLEQAEQPQIRTVPQWTIRRIMVVIAVAAPLLALTRYPFVFGLIAYGGSVALFVGLSIRRHRYDLIAWLLIFYPALPLLVLYINWGLAIRKIVGRSIPLFDGLIGLSDTCGYLCLLAYVGCVSILVRGRGRDWPPLKRAAWRVIIFMPIAWIALFIFAIWDPFGMLGYFFR